AAQLHQPTRRAGDPGLPPDGPGEQDPVRGGRRDRDPRRTHRGQPHRPVRAAGAHQRVPREDPDLGVRVSDPAELTHTVLLRVAEFIRKLPTDQLADLAEGTAKLELVPKGGRPAPRPRAAAQPAVSADRVRTDLYAIGDPAAARQYLLDLKLTVA